MNINTPPGLSAVEKIYACPRLPSDGDGFFYHADEMMKILRDACANRAANPIATTSGVAPLRRISAVGAVTNAGGDLVMVVDAVRMAHSFDVLLSAGFQIDPAFELDIVNIMHGRDFWMEKSPVDLAILCLLHDPAVADSSVDVLAEKMWSAQLHVNEQISKKMDNQNLFSIHDRHFLLAASPVAAKPSGCYQRLVNGDIKIVMSDFGGLDISKLTGPGYQTVIDHKMMTLPNTPMFSEYDFLFSDDYVAAARSVLNGTHPLVKKMDEVVRFSVPQSGLVPQTPK